VVSFTPSRLTTQKHKVNHCVCGWMGPAPGVDILEKRCPRKVEKPLLQGTLNEIRQCVGKQYNGKENIRIQMVEVTCSKTFMFILVYFFIRYQLLWPIPVAVRSKAWISILSLFGIAGSNRVGGWISSCCDCCVLSSRGLYVGLITRPRGVLPIVVCLSMIVKPQQRVDLGPLRIVAP
jgi:hypothetical protein